MVLASRRTASVALERLFSHGGQVWPPGFDARGMRGYLGHVRIATWSALTLVMLATACGGDEANEDAGERTPAGEGTAAPEEQPVSLDTARVERALTQNLDGVELGGVPVEIFDEPGGTPEQGELGGGQIDVRSVKCPADVPMEEGETFTCNIDGSPKGTVRVTQLDADGKRVGFEAKFSQPDVGVDTTIEGKTRVR